MKTLDSITNYVIFATGITLLSLTIYCSIFIGICQTGVFEF